MAEKKDTVDHKFAFVDSANFANSVAEMGVTDIDYEHLFKWLTERMGYEKVFYYGGKEPGDTHATELSESLGRIGYEVKVKDIMIYKNPPKFVTLPCPHCRRRARHAIDMGYKKKGNCDSELTLDAVVHKEKYGECLFFTGDGDFEALLDYLAKSGKRVRVASLPRSQSKRLSTRIQKLIKKGKVEFLDITNIKHIIERIDAQV